MITLPVVNTEKFLDVLLFPLRVLFWLLAQPINFIGWLIEKVKVRMYDPEQRLCPSCGFRGDAGTAGKTCRIETIKTTGPEKAAIKHTCFRCSAEYSSKTLHPAEKWMLLEPLKTK